MYLLPLNWFGNGSLERLGNLCVVTQPRFEFKCFSRLSTPLPRPTGKLLDLHHHTQSSAQLTDAGTAQEGPEGGVSMWARVWWELGWVDKS